MKALLFNVSDSEGGAARVTQSLHREFLRTGIDSVYHVQFARTGEKGVFSPSGKLAKLLARIRPEVDSLPLLLYPRERNGLFSPSVVPDCLGRIIQSVNPDVVHLNWICKGFIRIESIRGIRKPIVWTLHDSWGFTGGCHVPLDCTRYREECGRCPQLSSTRAGDLSRRIYRRKSRVFHEKAIIVVCPSKWLAACARASPMLANTRIEVIPNGIDTQKFKPLDRLSARRILNLPVESRIILFGAMGAMDDRNKGFLELREAITRLSHTWSGAPLLLVIFGANEPAEGAGFEVPAKYMGRLFDDISLSVMYSAADVFVAPSHQENLPTTVMEAMGCGTPAVCFNCSGFPDLIEHKESGYLADAYDPASLAQGISWVVENPQRSRELGSAARKKVESRFRIEDTAARYSRLFEDVIRSAN